MSTAPRLHIDFSPLFSSVQLRRRPKPFGIPVTRGSTAFFHLVDQQPLSVQRSYSQRVPPRQPVIDKGPSRPLLFCHSHHHCFHSQPVSCGKTNTQLPPLFGLGPPRQQSVLNVNQVLISTQVTAARPLPNQPVSDRPKMVFPANQKPIRFGKTLHGLIDHQSSLAV